MGILTKLTLQCVKNETVAQATTNSQKIIRITFKMFFCLCSLNTLKELSFCSYLDVLSSASTLCSSHPFFIPQIDLNASTSFLFSRSFLPSLT